MADHVKCGFADQHHPHPFDVIPYYNLGQPRTLVCDGKPNPKESN